MKLSNFFFNETSTTAIYTDLHTPSLHDALPIFSRCMRPNRWIPANCWRRCWPWPGRPSFPIGQDTDVAGFLHIRTPDFFDIVDAVLDRKSTRLNSSH